MSYMRGKNYIWSDGRKLYLWCPMTKDYGISMTTFDELVVMRYAEMTPAVKARAKRRAIKKYSGNLGCDALSEQLDRPIIETLNEATREHPI